MRRARSTVAFALAAAFAGAAGPALASVAAGHRANSSSLTLTSPQTITTSLTTTITTTSTSPTSTAPTTTTTSTQTTTTGVRPEDVCLARARRVIARNLRVSATKVSIATSVGGNGMPQCTYVVAHPRARSVPHTRAKLLVNVDGGPQAAWRLMRKVVEATQLFGPVPRGWHAPVGLPGLGPNASWFISLDSLMCSNHNGKALLTVTVTWKHAKRNEMIKLARATVEPYVHASAKALPIPVTGY